MPGGIVNTGSFPRLLWPGVNAVFNSAYNDYKPEWKMLLDESTSDKNYEIDIGMDGTGLAPIKSESQPIQYDGMQQTYESKYVHIVYGLGMIVTKEEIDDNLWAKFASKRTSLMARSLKLTRETVSANVYNNGFSGSFVYGDGQPAFSAAHPTSAGNQSNLIAVAADLSEAAVEQLIIDTANATDNRGLRIQLIPKMLLVPVCLLFEAERILGNPDRPATADRDINAMYKMRSITGGYSVNHYFSDPDAWFLKNDSPEGFKTFTRRAPEVSQDNDFDTDNAKFKCTERFSNGVSDWRQVFASPGA